MKDQLLLNPEYTFLNHGSFGSCPKPLFEAYQEWQRKLEFEPYQFIVHNAVNYLADARKALGDFLGCHKDDIVLMTNPTTAVNALVKNLKLEEGDEVLSTNLEYGACDRTWNYYCEKVGAKYIRQEINLPIQSKEQLLEDFWKGVSDETKVVFISHITSATALILPAKEIVEEAKKRGLFVIVDGAHVPGHIDLNIDELGADDYIGAVHKWLNGPKGCSFLHLKSEHQSWLEPLIVSWGYEAEVPSHSQFIDYHQMQGTKDLAAFCVTPEVIDYFEKENWWEKSKVAKQQILDNYKVLCDLFGTEPICPLTNEFLGQMCAIPVGDRDAFEIRDRLRAEFKVELPATELGNQQFIRLSTQAYVDQTDIDRLKDALKQLI